MYLIISLIGIILIITINLLDSDNYIRSLRPQCLRSSRKDIIITRKINTALRNPLQRETALKFMLLTVWTYQVLGVIMIQICNDQKPM